MENQVGKFEVFEDRLESLLVRWKKFAVQHPDKQEEAIQGCLLEMTDGFTQGLMDKEVEL